jgi:hypothetical protein
MIMSGKRFIMVRIACWWLALGVFAVGGLVVWTRAFVPAPPVFEDADAALDALAKTRLGLEHGALVLRRELDGLAPDAPVLVFGSGDDWTLTEAHFLISYIAWPRPVWCVGMMPSGQKTTFDNPPPQRLHPAALFFYNVSLPPGMPMRQLSPKLAMRETSP